MMTKEEIEARIAELEQERDELLRVTPYEWYAPRKTSHAPIRRQYNMRIANLRKFGVEYVLSMSTVHEKSQATKDAKYGKRGVGNTDKAVKTKLERYGNAMGNANKMIATRIERYGSAAGNIDKRKRTNAKRYGNAWGNQQRAQERKKEIYGHTGYGNYDKVHTTKQERYGYAHWNCAQAVKTKRTKYGNGCGDLQAMSEHNMTKFGVPWFCMTKKCKDAQGHIRSKLNEWWHNKILELTGYDFEYERNDIGRWSYDLYLDNVLIEISPAISHNCTYSYAYYVGKTRHNKPHDILYHYNKMHAAVNAGCVLIMIWDWSTADSVVALVNAAMQGTFVNAQCKDNIKLHWYKLRTGEHLIDDNFEHAHMIANGFVAVYDCGDANQ